MNQDLKHTCAEFPELACPACEHANNTLTREQKLERIATICLRVPQEVLKKYIPSVEWDELVTLYIECKTK